MRRILTVLTLAALLSGTAWAQTATVLLKEQVDTETELEGVLTDVTDLITDNDSAGGDLTGSYPSPTIAADVLDFDNINFGNTLAGNPALLADECYFAKTATGGCFICEGSVADTNEQLYCFQDLNGADTTAVLVTEDGTQTLTNKSISGDQIDSGTVPAARVGADHLDAVSEIAAGIKRGPDATDTHLLTTDVAAPAGKRCLEMDTDGSVTLATDTCANLGPGGTPTWEALTNSADSATSYTSNNTAETVTFSYEAAFTTGQQFLIRQQTGNPTGGTLVDIRAADTDVTVFRAGDGTNGITVSQAGALTAEGSGTIVATSGDSATGFFSTGEIADAQVVDTLTASNYLALAGGTMTGDITMSERSTDVSDPSEGTWVCWMSDGTGSGADGDVLCKITAAATTKFVTLFDFSAI